jgi:hypothetical protein
MHLLTKHEVCANVPVCCAAFGAHFLSSLLNVPYIKNIGRCVHDDCMKDLSIILVCVVGLRSLYTLVLSYMWPAIAYAPEPVAHWRKMQEEKRANRQAVQCCCVLCDYSEASRDPNSGCCDSCCPGLRASNTCRMFNSLCCCCCACSCSFVPCTSSNPSYRYEDEIGYDMYGSYNNENKFDEGPNTGTGGDADSLERLMKSEVDSQFDKPIYGPFDWGDDVCDRVLNAMLGCMFSSALPAAPALIVLSEWLWQRGQGWCWLYKYQRSVPVQCDGLGIWDTIISFACVVAVVTNAALTCFTMQNFSSWNATNTLLLFIALHWSLLFLHYCLVQSSYRLGDLSNNSAKNDSSVDIEAIQRERARFIESKLVEKVMDDVVSPHSML